MDEFRDTHELETRSRQEAEQKPQYTPRPKSHIILAWILAVIVFLAFLGTCYWMIFGRF